MAYKVVVTADAEEDLNQYIRYLLLEKRSGRPLEMFWMIMKIR
jgi:hypothetical protein